MRNWPVFLPCTIVKLSWASPSLETLINISEALHISIDTLVYGSSAKSHQRDLEKLFDECDEKDMAKLRKVLYTVAEEFVFER